ncbi:MAG: OmpA family protein, partial [Myxococcota bacterium]
SPSSNPAGTNVDSDFAFGPFFLIGGAFRITDWLTAGFAVYPVASAGATYNYRVVDSGGEPRDPMSSGDDNTTLFFFEMSPGLSIEIPNTGLSIGAGYRVTFVSLERTRDVGGNVVESPNAGFDMSGWSFAGVRAGVQWRYPRFPWLSLGVSYRHKTRTEIDGSGFIIEAEDETNDWIGEFTLPSRFTFAARTDVGPFAFAVDAEYALQDQNPNSALERSPPPEEGLVVPVTQRYEWSNAWTVRLGAEYRLMDGKLPLRLGYVWDQITTNRANVSAFSTPPTPTNVFTVGGGWNQGPWQVNIAYAYRTGSATVLEEELGERSPFADDGCSSCGFAGDYSFKVHGVYVDFSYHFGRGETRESGRDGRLGHGVIYGSEEGAEEPEPVVEPEPEPAFEPESVPEPAPAPAAAPTLSPAAQNAVAAQPVTAGAAMQEPNDVRIVGDHLEIDGTIQFESDGEAILAESNELLDHIAQLLQAHQEDISHLRVIGHTDAAGGHDYNQSLSERRAAAVVAALQARQVSARLESSGVGETQPVCDEDTDECHARNRRVEFIIVVDE